MCYCVVQAVPVTRRVVYEAENVQALRPEFRLEHGPVLDNEDILGRRTGPRLLLLRLNPSFCLLPNTVRT